MLCCTGICDHHLPLDGSSDVRIYPSISYQEIFTEKYYFANIYRHDRCIVDRGRLDHLINVATSCHLQAELLEVATCEIRSSHQPVGRVVDIEPRSNTQEPGRQFQETVARTRDARRLSKAQRAARNAAWMPSMPSLSELKVHIKMIENHFGRKIAGSESDHGKE
ncbi:hypothetical protein QAD02_017869 [Eretmocerus hayati]|uniref:Uncharacterized protein n=1 Tax=Eretmocerus hayati TaxID=131215 RepID=A0ACC2PI31_9HYME|nr:hypothetical protein QAD02_017869 [Eretmocerus hayati]